MPIATVYSIKSRQVEVHGPGYIQARAQLPLTRPWPVQGASMDVKVQVSDVEIKHWVDEGRDVLVGLETGTEDVLRFMWVEERAAMFARIHAAQDEAAAADKKWRLLRADVQAFDAMPWWKRMWSAYRKILP